jgi:hypothetical protein
MMNPDLSGNIQSRRVGTQRRIKEITNNRKSPSPDEYIRRCPPHKILRYKDLLVKQINANPISFQYNDISNQIF